MGMDGNHANSTNSHMTLALHSIDEGGTETLTETAYSIQHTAYNGTPGRLCLQREWGYGDGGKP